MCECVCVRARARVRVCVSVCVPGSKRRYLALKQHRLSQNISPVRSSCVLIFASDMHLESESEKRARNVDFHTAKTI